MNVEQLIFVGLNGYVVALNRDTGELVWSNNKMKSGYVTLLLDGDRLIVSTNGYIYCLDPLSGEILWNNPLKGYGVGTPASRPWCPGIDGRGIAPFSISGDTSGGRGAHTSFQRLVSGGTRCLELNQSRATS